jgi:hypothetical protein
MRTQKSAAAAKSKYSQLLQTELEILSLIKGGYVFEKEAVVLHLGHKIGRSVSHTRMVINSLINKGVIEPVVEGGIRNKPRIIYRVSTPIFKVM